MRKRSFIPKGVMRKRNFIPKGVMSGQDMLYMTTMESINNILAYCSPNLETG